jgi:hypothetical protein
MTAKKPRKFTRVEQLQIAAQLRNLGSAMEQISAMLYAQSHSVARMRPSELSNFVEMFETSMRGFRTTAKKSLATSAKRKAAAKKPPPSERAQELMRVARVKAARRSNTTIN